MASHAVCRTDCVQENKRTKRKKRHRQARIADESVSVCDGYNKVGTDGNK